LNWAEIKQCGRKILLSQIALLARLLNLSCDGRSVIGGYVKLFNGGLFFFSKVKPYKSKMKSRPAIQIGQATQWSKFFSKQKTLTLSGFCF
jgi:hypothetical protein